eukprot:m.375513 g.375513  ORF g.375513 m.375513 type:complete len:174 (-) comp28183_c3_seq11:110-631(-)
MSICLCLQHLRHWPHVYDAERGATHCHARRFGQEVWAKPLANKSVAVVMFNRDGEPCTDVAKYNPWHRDVACGNGGFQCDVSDPIDAPCTDVPHLSTGQQAMTLDYTVLPVAWFGADSSAAVVTECDVFDVFATARVGQSLGRFPSRGFSAVIPPHGSRFLILANCSTTVKPS